MYLQFVIDTTSVDRMCGVSLLYLLARFPLIKLLRALCIGFLLLHGP